ncbi:C25 family cysteine peptidase, partial [Bacteroidota bacterium]
EVNNGVNQITFFGHSGANVTDIDIGYASDPSYGYDNKGMYPYLYINGCNAGNIFTTNLTFRTWIYRTTEKFY